MVDPEPRPFSLPPHAPNRAQVRAIALRHGPWTEDGVAELTVGLRELIPPELRPILNMVYATESWLQRALVVAGFAQADTVIYFRLPLRNAGHALGSAGDHFFSAPDISAEFHADDDSLTDENTSFHLRPAHPEDIHALAMMDARAFDPIWHYPANDLLELMIRGRLHIAEDAGTIAGYSGLLLNNNGEAHLARLAVNPDYQGHGIGRRLLVDAIESARSDGCREFALNTQSSNQRSQALYRSVGMVETGVKLPVYVLTIE
jgi:ribosomal protein S18 acetylase RimI-like enzyme